MYTKCTVLGMVIAGMVAGTAGATDKPAAPKKALSEWTCEDFLAVDDTFKPKVVYWATPLAKGGKPEASVVDIEGTESVVPIVIEECQKSPKASFWQKLKAEWKKVEKKL